MIYTFGECLLDIIFRDGRPDFSCPGGSQLNVAVSIARFGVAVEFISEIGNDRTGSLIQEFLKENNVGMSHMQVYEGNSTLALAFLNTAGDAEYQFYHQLPEAAPGIELPAFAKSDVLVFGSFYSIDRRNIQNIRNITAKARSVDAVVMYDPNFRPSFISVLPEVIDSIVENIHSASLVRASDEDMRLIAGAQTGRQAYEFVKQAGCDYLIYTRNSGGVELYTPTFYKHYKVPEIKVISSVGAGDSFNAGIASFIHEHGKISSKEVFWDEAIARAIIFAAEVCTSNDNFIGRKHSSIK